MPTNTKPHTHPTHQQTETATAIISNNTMGLPSNEGGVTFSSIALLQQRFRELERIRVKREERLLQMLAPRPAAPHREVKWFFHPELLYPCRRPRADTAAALFPSSAANECKGFQLRGDPLAVDLWPSKHVSTEVDVDTSLHL